MSIARSSLLAVLLPGLLLGSGCAHREREWLSVSDAQFSESGSHKAFLGLTKGKRSQGLPYEERGFVLTGHRIAAGSGTILALREYAYSVPPLIHQAAFLKMTGFVPPKLLYEGSTIRFPNEDGTIAFISTSSAVRPGSTGCFGYASGGSIRIRSASSRTLTADIDLRFALASPLGFASECGEMAVKEVVEIPRRNFSELTPWHGVQGQSLSEEAIPRHDRR